MDEYSEFASDDFDVKAWVNATVANHLQQEQAAASEDEGSSSTKLKTLPPSVINSLDAHLSHVATKLLAVSASINSGLEKSMVEIMVSVPRMVTEVQRVEAGIQRLHAELANLSGQLDDIDHGTNAHVEMLTRLDMVKTNMGNCLHTLTEAASWNALVREVNARFGQDDLSGVAERLEAMVGSMGVLKDMPEAEDRAATLKELQEKLETLLQPKLLQTLKTDRVAPLMKYAAMYRQLGRMDMFRNEYCKAKAAAAHKRWFASASSASGGGVGGVTGSGLATWLPTFLEYLQGTLMDERKRTSDLFGTEKSPAVLCQLVVAAFQPLLGSFRKHLEAAPWPDAVGMMTEVLRFVGQVLELARGATERDLLAVLLSSAAAFHHIQDSFGTFERKYLSLQLESLMETLKTPGEAQSSGSPQAVMFTRRLEEVSGVSVQGFSIVQSSVGRCIELTAGYQVREVLKEASDALSTFLKAVRDAAQASRSLAGNLLAPSPAASASVPEMGSSDLPGEEYLKGMEADFDWQLLDGALAILGSAGRCQRCFSSLEEEFASALLRQRPALFASTPPILSSLVDPAAGSSSLGGVRKAIGVADRVGSQGSGEDDGTVAVLRAVLARVRLEEAKAGKGEVRARFMSLADPSSSLPGDVLPAPGRDVRAFAMDARSMVYDVCFAPIRARLDGVSRLQSWAEEAGGDAGQGWDASGGEDAWEYDTVPQAYMTQIGEHLLSLLQNLEPFANSDSFQDAAEATDDLHLLPEATRRECGAALGLAEPEVALLEKLTGASHPDEGAGVTSLRVDGGDGEHDGVQNGEGQGGDGGDGGVEGGEHEEEGEAARFCTAWLVCIGSGTVGLLLAKVLSLPRLSERGLKHLEADTRYLANVFHALDLAAPPVLRHLTLAVGLKEEQAITRLNSGTQSGYGPGAAVLTKIERRLAEARGVVAP